MAKYRYGFVDGTEEIEVSEEWAAVLREMDREEEANRKKQTRRHISLDAADFEGEEFAAPGDAESDLMVKEEEQHIEELFSSLTAVQRRRILLRMEGLTYRDIAKLENTSAMACQESITSAAKKMKKIL